MLHDRDIQALRKQLGMTVAGMARFVGVSERTVYRWLAGRSRVPESVWRMLAYMEPQKPIAPNGWISVDYPP